MGTEVYGFTIRCDTCTSCREFQVGNNWKEFIEKAKREGWKFKKFDNGGWEHYCPACYYNFLGESND